MLKDTLVYDNQLIEQINSEAKYDYLHGLSFETKSIFDVIMDYISSFFRRMNMDLSKSATAITFIVIVAILILIVFLVMRKYGIFNSKKDNKIDYSVIDKDIHSIDYENYIEIALKDKDYNFALILQYMHCLKILHDNKVIAWLPNKTATSYIADVLKPDFRTMTNSYIKTKYGNYVANIEDYDSFVHTKNKLIEELKDEWEK